MLFFLRHAPGLLAITLIASLLFSIPLAPLSAAEKSTGFVKGVSTEDIKAKYAEAVATGEKVRILIVPGHEPDFGGAQYAGFYERELIVLLADKLAAELRTDPNLEVLVARGTDDWNTDFKRYFNKSLTSVKKFVESHKKAMKKLQRRGRVSKLEEQASHNAAPSDVALRLYGISKWSNEHTVDLMLHLHLNDSGGHSDTSPGAYTGMAIYVPDRQYSNADASRDVAEEIFARLNRLSATSTLPIEDKGIVEDQQLIALGAYNTAEAPSVLIEYSYIYEPKNMNDATRSAIYADQALATAQGVRAFLGRSPNTQHSYFTTYTWKTDAAATTTATSTGSSLDLYALQVALRNEGFYPLPPSTLINCPVDGVMRDCVTESLLAYQKAKGVPTTGTLSRETRMSLNATYSPIPYADVLPAPTPAPTLATSASCVPFGSSLTLGSTDATSKGAVSRLQTILAMDASVYPEKKVTGYFGPATDKAVKAFQVKRGITKPGTVGYGIVGPATGKALVQACAS